MEHITFTIYLNTMEFARSLKGDPLEKILKCVAFQVYNKEVEIRPISKPILEKLRSVPKSKRKVAYLWILLFGNDWYRTRASRALLGSEFNEAALAMLDEIGSIENPPTMDMVL